MKKMKFKGNKDYKPITTYTKNMVKKIVYVPNKNWYEFNVKESGKDNGKLHVMGYNKKDAANAAKEWGRNLKRNLMKYHKINYDKPMPHVTYSKLLYRRIKVK